MAIGEAACVSVHGANRLGSNSLIDLVVFGRAAAARCAETVEKDGKHAELPKDSADLALSRLDHFRNASGGTPTAELRLRMQKVMQTNCAVFRTGETLEEGHKLIHDDLRRDAGHPCHRSIADLEFRSGRDARARQPDRAVGGDDGFRAQPHGKPWLARARGFPGTRRQGLDEAYARLARHEERQGDDRLSSRCTPTR